MTSALLDDHLIRDLLSEELSEDLRRLLAEFEPATTNLYLYRLSRSVVTARGGRLTGSWGVEERQALGSRLVELPDDVQVVPMRLLAFAMAEIASAHRVSALGAEAVAAAVHLGAPLCVWEGDVGPGIRSAIGALGASYRVIVR